MARTSHLQPGQALIEGSEQGREVGSGPAMVTALVRATMRTSGATGQGSEGNEGQTLSKKLSTSGQSS